MKRLREKGKDGPSRKTIRSIWESSGNACRSIGVANVAIISHFCLKNRYFCLFSGWSLFLYSVYSLISVSFMGCDVLSSKRTTFLKSIFLIGLHNESLDSLFFSRTSLTRDTSTMMDGPCQKRDAKKNLQFFRCRQPPESPIHMNPKCTLTRI